MRRSIIVVVAAALRAAAAPTGVGRAKGGRGRCAGRVVTVYENDNARPYAGGMHRGIDIAADVGTAVVAARAGTVTFAGPLGSSGNVVAVRDGRYATSYLHLGAVSVSRGERVAMGTRIGEVGTTGRRSVSEPHLHFGVRLAAVERPLRGSVVAAAGARRVAPPARCPVRSAQVPVPAGPVARAETGQVRHPVAAPSAPRLPAAVPDRGRPLVLGGLVLLALVLFGGVLVRANARQWRAVRSARAT